MLKRSMKRWMVLLAFLLFATPTYARHVPARARAHHGQTYGHGKKARQVIKKKAKKVKSSKKSQRRAAHRGKHRYASHRRARLG